MSAHDAVLLHVDSPLVVVKIGYQEFVVPAEVLQFVPRFRALDTDYIKHQGSYKSVAYWTPKTEVSVRFIPAGTVTDTKPAADPDPAPSPAPAPAVAAPLSGPVTPAAATPDVGLQAARDLVAESGDFSPMNLVEPRQ